MNKAVNTKAAKRGQRMGRPTSEESRQLDETIKDAALELFLEAGYDGASMEAIARAAGITKRTLYARYREKSELFLDALRWSNREWNFQTPELVVPEHASLEAALAALADELMAQTLNPKVIKLGRMVAAQAGQFPREAEKNYSMALSPRLQAIKSILARYVDEIDSIYTDDLEMTAELFLGLVTGMPARLASFGAIREAELEKHRVALAVRVFARGLRKQSQA